MKKVRQLHLYLGTLFAPLIIFFALTGILQTLELHEGNGTPKWIAQIASIHKKQALQSGEPNRPQPDGDKGAPNRPQPDGGEGALNRPQPDGDKDDDDEGDGGETQSARKPSPWPLKWFVVLMSIGLTITTGLGIYMAFKYERNKALVWGLLIAGTLLPLALLWV